MNIIIESNISKKMDCDADGSIVKGQSTSEKGRLMYVMVALQQPSFFAG